MVLPDLVDFIAANLRERAPQASDDARLPAMVEMPMGDEQLFNRHALFGRRAFEQRQISTRIGKGATHRFRAPDEAAILLQRCDGDDGGLERGLGSHKGFLARKARV